MSEEEYQANEEVTRLKDIDEELRFKIVLFLEKANNMYMSKDIIGGYLAIRSIFYIIQPFDFTHKDLLFNATKNINDYLDSMDNKPIDARHRFIIENKYFELKDLIDEYFQLIPFCLKELGLYLRIIKRRDDYDLNFSEETFNSGESLTKEKKDQLKTLSSDILLKYMTSKQIIDIYERIQLDIIRTRKLQK